MSLTSRLSRNRHRWTHPSVLALAGSDDPIHAVTSKARALAMEAFDKGWKGPPFDPMALAELIGIEVAANSEIRDARTVPLGRRKLRIEFNPNRPRARIRYSIAHEVAHTLFPDVADRIRNRVSHQEIEGDEWQLEALCNVAAAEILIPLALIDEARNSLLTAHGIVDLQAKFEVSTEALVIRLAQSADIPVAAFCASSRGDAYHIDYIVPSRALGQGFALQAGIPLPARTIIKDCSAIGYSARGRERWPLWNDVVEIEAIGIPPYPGSASPRVAGIVRPAESEEPTNRFSPDIAYVFGSALEPRGAGHRIVLQIVNDKTPNWGGGGFASALAKRWPVVQHDFKKWVRESPSNLQLGAVHFSKVDELTLVASIIAQRGYGESATPRIRYAALMAGLDKVANTAIDIRASIHMPRIGTGQAGGDWSIIRDLVIDKLRFRGIAVTLYDLPGSTAPAEKQMSLELFSQS